MAHARRSTGDSILAIRGATGAGARSGTQRTRSLCQAKHGDSDAGSWTRRWPWIQRSVSVSCENLRPGGRKPVRCQNLQLCMTDTHTVIRFSPNWAKSCSLVRDR